MYASWNSRAVGLNLTAAESIALAARAGFAGVDLLVRDVVESGVDPFELRKRMDDLGLRGGAWPLPVNWRGDTQQFEEDLARLPRLAEAARTLGLSRTGTWVLPEVPASWEKGGESGAVLSRAVDFHRERLGKIATILREHGSCLGLEVIGVATARAGRGRPFVTCYRDLDRQLADLKENHPNVGILLDGFHAFAAGEKAEDGFIWGTDRVIWVHLCDAARADRQSLGDEERSLPGETNLVECGRILRLLNDSGYSGPVTVEPLGRCDSIQGVDPLTVAERTAASLRSVWPGEVEFRGTKLDQTVSSARTVLPDR